MFDGFLKIISHGVEGVGNTTVIASNDDMRHYYSVFSLCIQFLLPFTGMSPVTNTIAKHMREMQVQYNNMFMGRAIIFLMKRDMKYLHCFHDNTDPSTLGVLGCVILPPSSFEPRAR